MSDGRPRSRDHTIAALLNVVISVVAVTLSLPLVQRWVQAADASGNHPPSAVIVVSFVLGIAGLVSSYGVWRARRWGVVLTIVVNVVSMLSGTPGRAFHPTSLVGLVVLFAGCVVNLVIISLLRRPLTRSPMAS